MSEPMDVPELSPDARAFLADHARTGEPTADELARGQALLEAGVAAAAPKPGPRRLPIPPEWLAVAAVLVALIAARGVFVLVHEHGASRQQVLEAYRAGDVEGALQRAKTECRADECADLEVKLAKAASLSSRIGALTPAEREALGELDEALAPGGTSAIALQLRAPRAEPSPQGSPEGVQGLADQARDLAKARNYEAAVSRLKKCVRIDPRNAECFMLLGSTYAKLATRDSSAVDMEKARKAYEQFLAVAPPDDEYVPKVRMILEAAAETESDAEPANDATPGVEWDTGPQPGDPMGNGELAIAVGGTGSIDAPEDIARVAIGDGSVADVRVVGARKLIVEGVEPGKTTVLFWLTSGARQAWLIDVRPK